MRTKTEAIRLERDDADRTSDTLQIIDDALREFSGRGLVSGTEVVDQLLEMRSAIVLAAACADLVDVLT